MKVKETVSISEKKSEHIYTWIPDKMEAKLQIYGRLSMTINIIIVLDTEKKELLANLRYMDQNTILNILRHIKYVLITTERKLKQVKQVNLKMNCTGKGIL